ncbi:MAG: glutathione S-transferase family protein [Sulfitobacter sp.]
MTLTLYYSKGSSALAAHILLEDAGAVYDAVEVSIPGAMHRRSAFKSINPKGRIPALRTPEGVLTENPAILEYIAASQPQAGLMPQGPYAQAQARSLCAYLCATVHVAFAHKQRAERWADKAASVEDMHCVAPRNMADCAAFLEADLALAPWAMGDTYSFCDPYLFLLGRWMSLLGMSLEGFPRLCAHRDAMLARPATQRALALHGLA